MELNGKQIGVHVADTHLESLGRAPRRSAKDQAPMGWYHCEFCGKIKAIRRADVRADHTVSCGCGRNERLAEYYEKLASEIDPSIRRLVYYP